MVTSDMRTIINKETLPVVAKLPTGECFAVKDVRVSRVSVHHDSGTGREDESGRWDCIIIEVEDSI